MDTHHYDTPGKLSMVLMLLFMTAISLPKLPAQDRERARELEQQGNTSAARTLYLNWINANPNHELSRETLFIAVRLSDTINQAVNLLLSATGVTQENGEKGQNREVTAIEGQFARDSLVWERLARLESYLGRIELSAEHFLVASRLSTDPSQSKAMEFESLTQQYAMGNYQKVRLEARELSERISDPTLSAEVQTLSSSALAELDPTRAQQAVNEILTILERLQSLNAKTTPRIWGVLAEIATKAGDRETRTYALATLGKLFPSSVSGYLSENRIFPWITPLTLQTEQTSRLLKTQAGAFLERSKASSFREELEAAGFISWLEYGDDKFWRVFISNEDGNGRKKLMEAGFL